MRHELFALAVHRAAIIPHDGRLGTRHAATPPACRVIHTVEHGLNIKFMPLHRADFHELTQTAACLACAA